MNEVATLPAANVPAGGLKNRLLSVVRRKQVAPTIVNKPGLLAPLLRPVGLAAAILVIGIPAIAVWNIYSASEARRAIHEAPVDRGETTATTSVKRVVADDETEFVLRLVDGKLVRVIAARDATDEFLNKTLIYLDEARVRAHQRAARDLDQVFNLAFATRQADIESYADWFFAWGRSWRFLYEAVTGAVQEAARLSFSRTQVTDAARHAVEAYLLRHYQDFVLKPGLRDPAIVSGVEGVLRNAHGEYLSAVAGLDDRMQRFLSEETRHVEEIGAGAIAIGIDWDAEKWRAPRSSAEDRYLEPLGSAAVIGGSAVLGSMLQRVVLPFFARTTAQVMVSSQLAVGGATVGSIQPGLGTALGLLAGVAIDWGLSQYREFVDRDQFVADNQAALDATIAAWKVRISPAIDGAIDVWFDDTRAIVARQLASVSASDGAR